MEEPVNLTHDEVLDIINEEFQYEPLRNYVVITLNSTDIPLEDENGENKFDLMDQIFSEEQYIIATGSTTYQNVVPGAKVLLDVEKLQRIVKQGDQETVVPNLKYIEVDDRMFGIITDNYLVAINKNVE